MLDTSLRRVLDPWLDRLGAFLSRLGFSANAITIGGFLLGCGAWGALAVGQYVLALGFIAANRIADGLDGALARKVGPTDLGGFLDIALDFIFYAGVPFFFAVGKPEFALPAAFLVFSFVGTGTSFLAFSTLAAKRGLASPRHSNKSLFYLGGLTEGAETIFVFVLMCLWPSWFAWLAWIFGGLCWLTTGMRVGWSIAVFRERESETVA
jgi:phosphatidylglycerophosphate synthase